jgi:hypothetical protein
LGNGLLWCCLSKGWWCDWGGAQLVIFICFQLPVTNLRICDTFFSIMATLWILNNGLMRSRCASLSGGTLPHSFILVSDPLLAFQPHHWSGGNLLVSNPVLLWGINGCLFPGEYIPFHPSTLISSDLLWNSLNFPEDLTGIPLIS